MEKELIKALDLLQKVSEQDGESTKKLALVMAGLKDTNWDKVTELDLTWETVLTKNRDIEALLPIIKLKKEPTF
jgi:hypothetical protein